MITNAHPLPAAAMLSWAEERLRHPVPRDYKGEGAALREHRQKEENTEQAQGHSLFVLARRDGEFVPRTSHRDALFFVFLSSLQGCSVAQDARFDDLVVVGGVAAHSGGAGLQLQDDKRGPLLGLAADVWIQVVHDAAEHVFANVKALANLTATHQKMSRDHY